MKTKAQWDESKLDFSRFISNGDEIYESFYWYFLEVVPHSKMAHWGFLCGEPYTHDSQGNALYDAFKKFLDIDYL